MSSADTFYDVLGLKHDASTTEIMTAYNQKVQKVGASVAKQQLLKAFLRLFVVLTGLYKLYAD